MKWHKLDNYCIKSDEWFIAKYYKAETVTTETTVIKTKKSKKNEKNT